MTRASFNEVTPGPPGSPSGRTLEELLRGGAALEPLEAARIGVEIGRALASACAAGHGLSGITACEVVLAEDGRIVLVGRGVEQRSADNGQSDSADAALYAAPETLRGEHATQQSDVYSVGVVLSRILTGAFPVSAQMVQQGRHVDAWNTRRRPSRVGLARAAAAGAHRRTGDRPAARGALCNPRGALRRPAGGRARAAHHGRSRTAPASTGRSSAGRARARHARLGGGSCATRPASRRRPFRASRRIPRSPGDRGRDDDRGDPPARTGRGSRNARRAPLVLRPRHVARCHRVRIAAPCELRRERIGARRKRRVAPCRGVTRQGSRWEGGLGPFVLLRERRHLRRAGARSPRPSSERCRRNPVLAGGIPPPRRCRSCS